MNRNLVLFLLILVAAGTFFFLLPNDEKKIRSNLTTLAEYTSSSPADTPIAMLKNVSLAAKLCSTPCSIHIESFHIERDFDKKALTDHILMMKKMLPDTQFTFHDTIIDFPENNRAELMTTLRLKGKISDNRFTDAYEISIDAEKIKSNWFFTSFNVVEFLEK